MRVDPEERSEADGAIPEEKSAALSFAIASLVVMGFALLVRNEEGAVIFGIGALLGLIGLGRGLYEAGHRERFKSGVGAAIAISCLTGVGGMLLLIALIDLLGGF